jgi:hypothetical protein
MNDAPNGGETDPRALELGARVQALEDPEEPLRVAHVEADAVVADEQYRLGPLAPGADLDSCLGPRAGVLRGIPDQVLEHEPQELRIALHFGEIADLPGDVPPGGLGLEDPPHLPHQACQVHPGAPELRAPDPREREEVIDERVHLLRGSENCGEVAPPGLIQAGLEVFRE